MILAQNINEFHNRETFETRMRNGIRMFSAAISLLFTSFSYACRCPVETYLNNARS